MDVERTFNPGFIAHSIPAAAAIPGQSGASNELSRVTTVHSYIDVANSHPKAWEEEPSVGQTPPLHHFRMSSLNLGSAAAAAAAAVVCFKLYSWDSSQLIPPCVSGAQV